MEKNRTEEWRPVPFLNGRYEASADGRVRRSGTKRLRSAQKNRFGYLHFVASLDGRPVDVKVHRAVAWAFLGAPPEGAKYVNHRNGDKTDNRVENLEWCSFQQNVAHARANGLCHDSKPVLQYDRTGRFLAEYPSIHDAARAVNGTVANISSCCNNAKRRLSTAKTAHGFVWRKMPDGGIGQFDSDSILIHVYPDQKSACLATGIGSSQMSQCCSGYQYKKPVEVKTAYGYVWRFKS